VNDSAAIREVAMSIAAVERDTGLSKDTLRVWERRYGFPAPGRDAFGERAYPVEQVDKLRAIKRLLDAGQRPGRIVAMDLPALRTMGEALPATAAQKATSHGADLQAYMAFIKAHDAAGLRSALAQAGERIGAAALVSDVIAPLNAMVGNAWVCGQLAVFEEHLYTQCVQAVLHNAITNSPDGAVATRPRVMLTTFPQEPHGLGLLMAELMLSLEGCACVSLGTQTPVLDMVRAATVQQVDVVALSVTGSQNTKDVVHGLRELRLQLPRGVEIWVGGSNPVITRKPVDGVTALTDLRSIKGSVAAWRARHT
jgi:MerR family transcriptional regulator, light-induced transcriptional regulator